jgi:polyhydroxybutyrate depolymerase
VPERAVSVLHVHGTSDDIVPFDGGALGGQGAVGSVEQWARHDGCDLARTAGTPLDLEAGLAGAETVVESSACPPTVAVDLWRVEGASHVPVWGAAFTPALWRWLSEHRRR